MPTIERSEHSRYSSEQLFDLVNDVARYPEFVPGCSRVSLRAVEPTQMEAELCLSGAGLNYRLVTRNHLQRPETIRMEFVDGPFRQFRGDWCFVSSAGEPDAGCMVSLRMCFELRSRLLKGLVYRFSESLVDRMVTAMCRRADILYGRNLGATSADRHAG